MNRNKYNYTSSGYFNNNRNNQGVFGDKSGRKRAAALKLKKLRSAQGEHDKMLAEKAAYESGAEKQGGFLGFGGEYAPNVSESGVNTAQPSAVSGASSQSAASALATAGGSLLAKEGVKALGKEATKTAGKEVAKTAAKEGAKTAASAGLSAGASAGIGIAGKVGGDMIDGGGTTTSSSAGIAGGAVKGAATGAAFGVPGALIGGAIGGISGGLKARANRKKKQAEAEQHHQERLEKIEGEKTMRLNSALAGLGEQFSRTLV